MMAIKYDRSRSGFFMFGNLKTGDTFLSGAVPLIKIAPVPEGNAVVLDTGMIIKFSLMDLVLPMNFRLEDDEA
jgi:hypothetical protein